MKKIIMTVFASLIATSLFADAANNWLRIESAGTDLTLAGALVPSGTVYNVVHEQEVDGVLVQTIVLSNATDEVGWYPESVAQVWDVAENAPFTNGVFKFVLFDNTHGDGAIVRYLAVSNVEQGVIMKLAADVNAPYEISDASKLDGTALVVGANVTLDLASRRTGYTVKTTSAGTLLASVTDAEWEQYQDGETLSLIPMSEAGTFAGTLKLVSPSGTSLVAENLAVVDNGSGGYVLQTCGHEPYGPGYLDIPFKMTAINALKYDATGSFGGENYSFSTNVTIQDTVNFERNDNNSSHNKMGGASTYLWYSTSADCTYIKDNHRPAVNCQLNGKGTQRYWQFDFPVDFGEKTFKLGSAQAGFFLCTGDGGWQQSGQTRIFASTLTAYDEDGNLIGSLAEGSTESFGEQTVATNTMAAASSIALTGKVKFRFKAYLPNTQNKDASYSGCTGIKLLEAREYTATISGDADFSDIVWKPSRLEPTANDDLIVSNTTAGATLTFDETENTIGTLHLAGARTILATNGVSAAAFTSIVAGPDTVFDYKGDESVSVPSGAKATIPGWTTPSKITGAGTLAFDAGTKDGAIADIWSSSFGTTGTNAVTRGTWLFTAKNTYPSNKDILISGENAILKFTTTSDIAYGRGGTLTIENGGAFQVYKRDTFNRVLNLRNGGKLLFDQDSNDSSRAFDMYSDSGISVTGSEPSIIGKIGDETSTSGSGIIAIRRSGFTVTVASGSELQCYSAWSTAASSGGNFIKAGAGKMVQYRDSSSALPFVVQGGTLKYVNGGRTTTAGITLNDGCKLELSATDSGSYTLANVISGKGRIEKQDSGTYTLTGANTYSGTTTVKAGTLIVNDVSALGSTSGVTINSGATLQMPLVEDETAFTIGGEGTLRLVMTEAQREQLGTITSGVKTTLPAANIVLVDTQGEEIDDREATIVDGKVQITLKGGYFLIAWNGSAWTNTEGVVTTPTDKSILVMQDGDVVNYSTAITPHMMILPESGLVAFTNQNNLGALAVDIPENTTLEFRSNAAYTGAISGSGTLKLDPGQVQFDGQTKLPSTLFTEFTGTLQWASGRLQGNTTAYPAGMTVEILDGAQLYFNKSVSWPCAFIARGNGWTGTDNAIAKAGPMRCENGVTITGNVTFDNGDSAPNFVAWNNTTCTINGYVTATNGLNITGNGNGGTLKFSAPFSCSNVKGTVTLTGGNLTFGSGSVGSDSNTFTCGDTLVVGSGRTFTLDVRGGTKIATTSLDDKAKFATAIVMNGGTYSIVDGNFAFTGGITVDADSTLVCKWGKSRVFSSISGDATLYVQGTANSGSSEKDGFIVFRGDANFTGKICGTANSIPRDCYIIPIGQALAKATVDLKANSKLRITEAATIGGLDGAKPITIDNGATETQTLTVASGGTVSLLTDTSTAAIASTANLNLSGAVIDLNATTTTPVAEDSTDIYYLAQAPSITTNGVKMAKGTWAFTVEKVDGNDVLKAQKTAKGFYIIIADNKTVTHGESTKNAVNIDRDWIKTATAKDDDPITDDSSESDVETALNGTRENGVSLWENYVLGLEKDVSTSIPVVTPVQTSDADSMTFALGNVKVNDAAGANVTYKVLSCDTLGGTYTEASDSVAHDKTVAVDLPESGVKYYKFEVDVSSK